MGVEKTHKRICSVVGRLNLSLILLLDAVKGYINTIIDIDPRSFGLVVSLTDAS